MTQYYQVELAPAAQRQIKKLPSYVQRQIIKHLDKLPFNPRPNDVKKLAGMDNLYRIRIEDYRIIYTVNDKELIILVVKVGNCKEIYRPLSNTLG